MSARATGKTALAADVWRLICEFGQAQFGRTGPRLQALGLTPGHLRVLMLLEPEQARPMGALAQECACDASTMTWLVDRLEERALVERRPMPGDRRVKAVALTEAGIEMKRKVLAEVFKPPPELVALDRPTLEALRSAFASLAERRAR